MLTGWEQQLVPAAEPQEVPLEVASRSVVAGIVPDGKSEHPRLGRHAASLGRKPRVTYCVDTPMDSVQAPGEHPASHCIVAHPGAAQLSD